MDSASAEPLIRKSWLWGMAACVLAALLLPWFGFDFHVGSLPIHLHSLKNPTGAFFTLLGVSLWVPVWRSAVVKFAETLDPWVMAGIAALLLINIKLYQHFALQTHAFDLGIFANICWNTLHGRFLYDSVKGSSYFADHFQPILILLAPALRLWNNAGVLLALQAVGFALAAPPLFRLTRKRTGSRSLAAGLCLLYLTRPSVHAVNGFDFHPEALAVPILLWGLWFLEMGRRPAFWGSCLLALTLKEDVPFALAALGLVIVLTNAAWREQGFVLIAVAIGAFLFETQVVIPHYLQGLPSVHFSRYSRLGSSYGDILTNLFKEPGRFMSALLYPAAKWSGFVKYAGSFGFLPMLSPASFFPAIGALLPHLLSGYAGQYTLSGHYAALSLPFMLSASSRGMARVMNFFKSRRSDASLWMLGICLILSGGALLTNARYARPVDWERVREFYRLTRMIPPEASVRAQSDLLAHVCLREKISLFAPYELYKDLPLFEPSRAETDYVLIDINGNTWPMDHVLFKQEVMRLSREGRYDLVADKNGFELWRRKH
jgi:uncharacterized membrane protein